MKERPIIFNTENVKAILEGRKTQTRRVIKPQPDTNWHIREYVTTLGNRNYALANGYDGTAKQRRCPYGQVGDRLWVRETFFVNENDPFNAFRAYRASPETYLPFRLSLEKSWRPSIFMPRWASRITLEITEIRVERLQEITEEDAKAEGIEEWQEMFKGYDKPNNNPGWTRDAILSYQTLWDSLNPKYPWESNPWVWVISFKRVT